jgi:hypothetical protein
MLKRISPNSVSDRGFSIMLLLYTCCALAGTGCVLVPPSCCPGPPRHEFQTSPGGLPEVVPHPGLRNRIFVDQNENRDLISAGFFAQNPNPGSDRAYTKRDTFYFSPRVGAVGGHLATVSLSSWLQWLPSLGMEAVRATTCCKFQPRLPLPPKARGSKQTHT